MRAILLALALGAATAGAQVTAPAMPVAPKPKSSGGELRIGGIMISGERSYDFLNSVENEAGSIKGIDVLLRARIIGLSFRSLSGTFGDQPHVTSADARLLLGPPVFTIMAGAGRRARRGMGLHVMQHRADAMGGTLVVQRLPHGGSEVVCSIPEPTSRDSDSPFTPKTK